MKINFYADFFIACDKICDYTPVVCTVSNIVDLAIKILILPFLNKSIIKQDRYFSHISNKSFARCICLLIPIGTQFIALIIDIKRKQVVPDESPKISYDNEDIALRETRKNWRKFQYANASLRNSLDVVSRAVTINPFTFEYAGNDLKNDKEAVLAIVSINWKTLRYVNNNLRRDQEVALRAINQNGLGLALTDVLIKRNKEIVLLAVQKDSMALQYADNKLRHDNDVVMEAVTNNGMALEFASEELRNDKDVVMKAVTNNGMALEFASEELRNNKDVVMKALNKNNISIMCVGKLTEDKEFIIQIIDRYDNIVFCLYQSNSKNPLLSDVDVIKCSIKKDISSLKYASNVIRGSKKFILEAININPIARLYAKKEIKNDPDILSASQNLVV